MTGGASAPLRVATRGSPMALWQTHHVIERLSAPGGAGSAGAQRPSAVAAAGPALPGGAQRGGGRVGDGSGGSTPVGRLPEVGAAGGWSPLGGRNGAATSSDLAPAAAGIGRRLEPLVVSTEADRRLDLAIAQLGGKGAFAKEVQAAVLDGRADLAVHSAKDLPSVTPDGLVVAAVLERHDPRDALVGRPLGQLAPGARVGTGSPRRRAQLAWCRPDLTFAEVRGNVGTRLAKLDAGRVDALVLAVAGLERLGLAGRVAEALPTHVMLPQVAQGTLCVECRADDRSALTLLAELDHGPTRRAFEAERGFLVALGGDCYLPAGALATVGPDGDVELEGLIASLDGHVVLRHRARGTEPGALGREVAEHLLDRAGGRELLAQ